MGRRAPPPRPRRRFTDPSGRDWMRGRAATVDEAHTMTPALQASPHEQLKESLATTAGRFGRQIGTIAWARSRAGTGTQRHGAGHASARAVPRLPDRLLRPRESDHRPPQRRRSHDPPSRTGRLHDPLLHVAKLRQAATSSWGSRVTWCPSASSCRMRRLVVQVGGSRSSVARMRPRSGTQPSSRTSRGDGCAPWHGAGRRSRQPAVPARRRPRSRAVAPEQVDRLDPFLGDDGRASDISPRRTVAATISASLRTLPAPWHPSISRHSRCVASPVPPPYAASRPGRQVQAMTPPRPSFAAGQTRAATPEHVFTVSWTSVG